MSVMGKGISATVSITLPKGTDQASVTVNPNSTPTGSRSTER